MSGAFLLILIAIALLIAWWYGRMVDAWNAKRDPLLRHERNERPNMPAELQAAELTMSEQLLIVKIGGAPVSVKPDQVYRTEDKRLIPVETKTRNRVAVYDYDRIELSVQRLALAQKYGMDKVSPYGYVRVVQPRNPDKPYYIHVKLLSQEDLADLLKRREKVLKGEVEPRSQTNPRACRGCGFRQKCPKSAA